LPSPALLRIHFRFAAALHLFFIEDRIAEGWPQTPPGMFRALPYNYPKLMVVMEQPS